VHLGAARIVAVSTRHRSADERRPHEVISGYPPPAQVLGVLLNAIFLDLLDQDAMQLERVNSLIEDPLVQAKHPELRPVRLLVLRPSQDLGALARDYEPRLPGAFRFLTRRLGTRETRSQDLLSMVMFQGDYVDRLIEMGEADADARTDEIAAIIEPDA
jgi:NTE family protein